jgi:hypothetical protein
MRSQNSSFLLFLFFLSFHENEKENFIRGKRIRLARPSLLIREKLHSPNFVVYFLLQF